MTRRASLWLGFAGTTAAAVTALALANPPAPSDAPLPLALCAGVLTGLALFGAVERRLPPPPRPGALRPPVWLAKHGLLVVWAGVEEIVWRALALAELTRVVGAPAALGAASVAFALWHPARKRLHVLTGLVFGTLFLTIGLGGAWAAHAAYNGAVAVVGEQRRGAARSSAR